MVGKQALKVINNVLKHEGYDPENTKELVDVISSDLNVLDILLDNIVYDDGVTIIIKTDNKKVRAKAYEVRL